MSLTSASRGLAPTHQPSALPRLIAVDLDEFASSYWSEKPLLSRASDLPQSFSDLFSLDAADELLSTRGLRAPFVRVAKNGNTLPDSAFTSGGGVGAGIADQVSDDKLLRLFADGATIVLQGLHRTWLPINEFTAELAEELGHPVQANAYVTPRQSQGFNDHYDVHDVFVLQISGEKHWRIRPPVHKWPTRDQPWTDYRDRVEAATARPPMLDVTLHEGDCLYLPRGYLHSATATEDVSAHLTLGVHTWTGIHVAQALVDEAIRHLVESESDRAPLDLGTDVANPLDVGGEVERLRARLHTIIDRVDIESVAASLARQDQRTGRPSPLGPLVQARRAGSLNPNDELQLRPFVRARLVDGPNGPELVSRAGSLTIGPDQRPAMEAFLANGTGLVSDLGIDLARHLLTCGIAT